MIKKLSTLSSVFLLMAVGVHTSVNAETTTSAQDIVQSIRAGETQAVERALAESPELFSERDTDSGKSLVTLLIQANMEEQAMIAVTNGARVDIRDNNGVTPYNAALDAENPQLAHEIMKRIPRVGVDSVVSEMQAAKVSNITDAKIFLENRFTDSDNREAPIVMTETASVQDSDDGRRASDGRLVRTPKPRLLYFDPNGGFVGSVTLKEDSDQGAVVEMREFDYDKLKINFRELKLEGAAAEVAQDGQEQESLNLKDHLGPINPGLCISCHGKADLWNSGPKWPGAIGSEGDELGHAKTTSFRSWSGELITRTSEVKKELKNDTEEIEEMLAKIKRGAPGYAHLKSLIAAYDPSSKKGRETDPNTNRAYTKILASRNFDRIAGEIMAKPHYADLKMSIMSALMGCQDDKAKLLPEPERQALLKSELGRGDGSVDSVPKVAALAVMLDSDLGTDFTENGAIADSWPTLINIAGVMEDGVAEFGPFTVGPNEHWTVSRIGLHLRTHDSELRQMEKEKFSCPNLIKESVREIAAFKAKQAAENESFNDEPDVLEDEASSHESQEAEVSEEQ